MENLKELIAKNIEGQGSQVDLGNALPKILNGIIGGAKFNAQAKITCRVIGYKLNEDEDAFEANAGATGTVIVKGFSESGQTLTPQEINVTLDDEGKAEVEVTANIGDTIGVIVKVADSGASCQMVQRVVGDVVIPLESYPVGIWEIGDDAIHAHAGEDSYNGCAIIAEDFAIALAPYQRTDFATEAVPWGGMFQDIPFVMKAADADAAITDFDGALNTAAILSVVKDANSAAAKACASPYQYPALQPFLPSAGMLKYLYAHKTEINTFIAAETTAHEPDTDYDLLPNNIVPWSSTDHDPSLSNDFAADAWTASFGGGTVRRDTRYGNFRVLSVSAFQFVY